MATKLSALMSFSEEQSMLLDTASVFCKKVSPVSRVRELLIDDKGYDAGVWQEIIELGWPGIAVPEDLGGSGLGLAAVVPLVEPMGKHLMATPYVSSQIAIQALLAGGNEEQQSHWLPRLAEGGVASVAFTEQNGNWNLSQINCAIKNGMLSGSKSLVADAAAADLLLVSLMHNESPAIALVPTEQIDAGRMSRETVLDETRRSSAVNFDGVQVTDEQLITGSAAQQALAAAERAAWLLYSAEACGGTNATIDLVVEYLNTRTQFGHKIGSYQALKHPTVDMLMGLERSRSHLYHAASLIAAAQPDNESAPSPEEVEVALRMAKADSADAYNFAADRAIQFHGGFGFTYECDAQLYLRRALWLQYQFGDSPHHRSKLQQALLDD